MVEIAELLAIQSLVWEVHIDESLQDYIVALIGATRRQPDLALGASPRGSLALYKTAQALAAMQGRDFVIPDDLKFLAPVSLAHRLVPRPEAELRGKTVTSILNEIIESIPLFIE